MEIKKSYEYGVYKQITLSITFADEEEYKTIVGNLKWAGESNFKNSNPTFDDFCQSLADQLEAPCS